jgi:heat shock protein HslJ
VALTGRAADAVRPAGRSRLAALLVAALVLAAHAASGCGGEDTRDGAPEVSGPTTGSKRFPWERSFTSTAVVEDGEERPLVDGTSIELTIGPRRNPQIGWNAGCNGFGGHLRVEGGRIHVDEVTGTLIGCPEPLEAQDQWLAGFFQSDPHWERSGERLTLSADGTVIDFTAKAREPAGRD